MMRYFRRKAPDTCPEFFLARNRAIGAVQRAKMLGLLPALSECVCIDCGDAAQVYEHRDYSKPLEVDPVCQRCNIARGRAKWEPPPKLNQGGPPRPRHFEAHFLERAQRNVIEFGVATPWAMSQREKP